MMVMWIVHKQLLEWLITRRMENAIINTTYKKISGLAYHHAGFETIRTN